MVQSSKSPKTSTDRRSMGGNIKEKVYENNWSANNLDQLRLKISSVIRNLDPKLVQKHDESVKNRLYQLVRYNKM